MSVKTKTGQLAEIAGPQKANIFPNAKVAATLISRGKRLLLVIGSESIKTKTNDGDIVDTAIKAMKNPKVTVVATGHLIGEFRKRGAINAHSISIFVLGDRLRDTDWKGFDGKGNYDTIIFVGFLYYLEWLVESGLKSFAQGLRTISLDRSYQPNSQWSLGWMSEPDWRETLDTIVSKLEEER